MLLLVLGTQGARQAKSLGPRHDPCTLEGVKGGTGPL